MHGLAEGGMDEVPGSEFHPVSAARRIAIKRSVLSWLVKLPSNLLRFRQIDAAWRAETMSGNIGVCSASA